MRFFNRIFRKKSHIGYLPVRYIPTYGKYISIPGSEVAAKVLVPYAVNGFFSKHPHRHLCKCSCRIRRKMNRRYVVPKNAPPLFRTADGYDIASADFKLFCESNGYEGLEFIAIPKSPGRYWMVSTLIYEVDWGRGYTYHGEYCRRCGNVCYDYPFPMFKSPYCEIKSDDFIARTHIEYGDFNRAPMLVVGLETERKLAEAGFGKLYFEPVYF